MTNGSSSLLFLIRMMIMLRSTQKASLFLILLLGVCQAFHVGVRPTTTTTRCAGTISSSHYFETACSRAIDRPIIHTRLHAERQQDESSSGGGGGGGGGSDDRKATAEAEQEQTDESASAVAASDSEAQPAAEDPEIVALKQEIADLESSLKAKHSQVDAARDQVELYSKAGYARKVAEMENMRRLRSTLNSSSREASMAAVLTNFLPVLDELKDLNAKYKEDEFGSKYNAFYSDMNGALKTLGVEDFTAQVGEKVILNRHRVVEEEYSEQHAKGTVIRPVAMGLELQGNVIREAECVASLGSKKAEEEAKAAEEEAKAAEEAAAAAAAEGKESAEAADEGESEPSE